jgi:hypothetical protein
MRIVGSGVSITGVLSLHHAPTIGPQIEDNIADVRKAPRNRAGTLRGHLDVRSGNRTWNVP